MGEFEINTSGVRGCTVRISTVQNVVQQQANVIDDVLSDLGEIGLDDIVANIERIRDQLCKQAKIIGHFNSALNDIVRRYILAENNISGASVVSFAEDVSRTGGGQGQQFDDFWNNDDYFGEGWYNDHDKFIEAYKKMIEELENGRIDLDKLMQGASEDNPNHMIELIQYLIGADPTGYIDEDTFNKLQLFVKDYEENGHTIGYNDFTWLGDTNDWSTILSVVHCGLSEDEAMAAYIHNIGFENGWNVLHPSDGVHPVYMDDQNNMYIQGMYSNAAHPVETSCGETFCENIAIYNAMEYYNPGNHASLSDIVYYNTVNNNLMGAQLWGIHVGGQGSIPNYHEGGFGVDTYTIPSTLEQYGYSTTQYSNSATELITPDLEDVVIISSINSGNDITSGIHTYCLTAENGHYVAHNAYGVANGKEYDSVEAFVTDINTSYTEPISVINIIGVSVN